MNSLRRHPIRRHPHVFSEARAESSEAVRLSWEAIKAAERAEQTGGEQSSNPLSDQLAGKVRGQPALAAAMTISRKAAKAGFEWDAARDCWKQSMVGTCLFGEIDSKTFKRSDLYRVPIGRVAKMLPNRLPLGVLQVLNALQSLRIVSDVLLHGGDFTNVGIPKDIKEFNTYLGLFIFY